MSKIIELSKNLQIVYDALNDEYYDGKLPEVVLTIIKEISRNFRYHNDKFLKEAEKRGLICEEKSVDGWSMTKPSASFSLFIGQIVTDDFFNIKRISRDVPPPII